MLSIQNILKQYWGYSSFRPLQEDIINFVMQGKDCLALLPTGGGKSVCFQVPALAQNGLCLVVSPLIALMKDQVENLRKKGITAFSIQSGMSRREVVRTLSVAADSNCKFLYVSPERLETNLFKEYLPSLDIRLIAVDEAHCISQWGYDFRPSYLRIAALREELPGVPVLALSASATPEVQEDICNKLIFTGHKIFRQTFERPNLSYSVFDVSSRINKVVEILTKVNGTAIVYCKSRRRTKEFSDQLNMHGISSENYHAGLLRGERDEKQEAWLKNDTRVIVCTNAFGMGIDKPDVRVVIHVDTPDCLENYYQEAGRAGRDGKRSYAVLLFNDKEIEDLNRLCEERFPQEEVIRKIYQALMNHLQIPSGSGEGNYYEFDINAFIRYFKLETKTVVSVLKILEQEGLLYVNEQVFVPSVLQVIAEKELLNDIENLYPSLEPLLKTLLRTYEGIIDHQVNINERHLSSVSGIPLAIITARFQEMQMHGIIKYVPQKEKPQVYLVQNRVRADDLKINTADYNKRKIQFRSRVDAMINYVNSSDACRSQMIANYFGDTEIKPCGICDNCLNQKKTPVSEKEFEDIHRSILELINIRPLTLSDVLSRVTGFPKEKTKQVIRFLQAEEKIEVDERGLICKSGE